MSRKYFNMIKYIDDSKMIADQICLKRNFEKFSRLLIDESLKRLLWRALEANSIRWRYTDDFKVINQWKTYSFRFPNLCDVNLYDSFNVYGKNLFQKTFKTHHRSREWYRYSGENLLKYIGEYLDIQKIVHFNNDSPITMLFVQQKQRRIDIYFYFKSINTKIAIMFESGDPLRIN
ncbi:hypothetical protein I4U23_017204 [Adineta vaga]|nr:hypothetical protein I4U23_017204 [Adineta vaga]